ncbi:MAG: GAF domain-containing protein [Gemmatimonadetes bacterium]|nr:GAF domain-containing protein [Gemmatimonadota bacterium]NNM32408.1 GAF domain-containing protein [Gemmatimonadota bacterium]
MIDAGELLKELQEMRDDGHLSDALLRHAVRTVKKSDKRYDWVGVYLLGEGGDELWLHNYVGQATEHAKIPVGTGVCGTAVAEATNQNVPDVSAVSNYLACDPRVKSELVVLIRAGDEIFGQLDVDSREAAAFNEEDEAALGLVADKLAEQIAHERR